MSRLIYGARISLYIGLVAEGVALTIGIILGSLAGYLGGWVDDLIMRLTDIFFAVPSLAVFNRRGIFVRLEREHHLYRARTDQLAERSAADAF